MLSKLAVVITKMVQLVTFSWLTSWLPQLFGHTPSKDQQLSPDERLLTSADNGDLCELIALLKSDADINTSNKQDSTPLHLAVKNNHQACVHALLQHPNVCLDKLDKWGRTSLHTAVVWQRLDILKSLLVHEPGNVNITDTDGKTCLHYAASNGALDFVTYLIQNKSDLDTLDHRKWTPLMCAVAVQSVETVSLLLKHGASCNQPQKYNLSTSALRLAIERHNLKIVDMLLEYGALVEFNTTYTLGSFSSTGHRQSNICHNLATFAVECVDLMHAQSIEIADRVVRASPIAPDEDVCVKLYEQYIKPSKRLRRSMSRELIHLIETISDDTVSKFISLLDVCFAVGIELSKSNIDRLKRKFKLDERQDILLFELITNHRHKSLLLQSSLSIRKSLIDAGHNNVVSAVRKTKPPKFIERLVMLQRW